MSDNLTVVVISGSKNEVFSKLNKIVGTNLDSTPVETTPRYLTASQERIVKNYLKSTGYTRISTPNANYWMKG
jgi:ABC-type transporter Mla maintaining outer membrane lipid asymmetry ATPase subunit MlaF